MVSRQAHLIISSGIFTLVTVYCSIFFSCGTVAFQDARTESTKQLQVQHILWGTVS